MLLKQLAPTNLWNGSTIVEETMTLGFVVPQREIYAALIAAQEDISQATDRILNWQLAAFAELRRGPRTAHPLKVSP